jgi:hypothetical protein
MAKLLSGTEVFGNLVVDTFITATGNVIGGNIVTAGLITATGNATVGNISATTYTGTTVSVTGTATAASTVGGIITGSTVSATGNITGNYILGNGSQLTGLPATYSNANVATFLAAFGSNTISTTGTINSGNITGGNLLTAGNVSATGNVTANYFIGNGSQLTGVTSSFAPIVFNNVSTQTNSKNTVFALKQNQTAATGITNSKQLQVTVNGAIQTPYVKTWVWPFWSVYGSYPGFRVTNLGYGLTANSVIIYNAPAVGSQVTVTQINNSTDTQLQRYPFSATTIATSDD